MSLRHLHYRDSLLIILIPGSEMPTTADLLKEAESNAAANPQKAEQLYKEILSSTAGMYCVECTLLISNFSGSLHIKRSCTKWGANAISARSGDSISEPRRTLPRPEVRMLFLQANG